MSLTKKDLSREISKNINIPSKDADKFIETFISLIKSNLPIYDIKLSNFGTFLKKNTPERIGRNPLTKKEYIIKKSVKISFKSSLKLKKLIN